ncbi:MAG: WhiB family transcriptional regulator [Microthrixaceae bacterium]
MTAILEMESGQIEEGPVGWESNAACSALPTAMFFTDDVDEISAAKRVCLRCEVRLSASTQLWPGGSSSASGVATCSWPGASCCPAAPGAPTQGCAPPGQLPEVDVPAPYRRLVASTVA